jgi:chromosome segregation ATPase
LCIFSVVLFLLGFDFCAAKADRTQLQARLRGMRVFVSLLVTLSDALESSLNDRKARCVHYVSHLEHTLNVRDGLARKTGSKTIRNRLLRSQLQASKQHSETLGRKLFGTESSRQTAARQLGDAQGKLQATNKEVETLKGRLSTALSKRKSSDTDLTSMKSRFDASNKQVLSLQQGLSTAHDNIGSL